MSISKEKLSDYKAKYEEVENLVEFCSTHDPSTQPLRSHYMAKDILVEMQNNLQNLLRDLPEDEENESRQLVLFILGFICKDTGRIYVFTDEWANAEYVLMKCIALLEPYKMRPECKEN